MIYVISRELETHLKNNLPSDKIIPQVLQIAVSTIFLSIILPAFKTDHSSVSVIISNYNEIKSGPSL